MNNHEQDHQVASEDWGNLHVLEALFQSLSETKLSEKNLENQQTGERSQFLIFKTDHGNFMVFGLNFCFTGLHLRWPPGCGLFWYA
jgi:hypothetical protein